MTDPELDIVGSNLEAGTELETIVSDSDSDVWGATTVATKTVARVDGRPGDGLGAKWQIVWESGGYDDLADVVEDTEHIRAVRAGEETDHYLTLPDEGEAGDSDGDGDAGDDEDDRPVLAADGAAGIESGDEAIAFATEQTTDRPVDELTDSEIEAELDAIETALEWEKPRHDDMIGGRKRELEAALDYDAFDAMENDRTGSYYLISASDDSVIFLDGAFVGDGNCILHYHYSQLSEGGLSTGGGAEQTLPDDEDSQWISVADLDQHIADGTAVPATVEPQDDE